MANLRLTTTATGRLEDALELAQRIHRSAADEKGNPKLMGPGWEQRRLKKETNIYNVIHAGKSSGYRSAVVISPNLNNGVVVLCNDETSTLSPYEMALLLLDIIRNYQ